jgi:hypothetical protein
MDTEQLGTALRGATAGLEPRPGLTGDVVRGGKRRLRQRRITVTAVTAVAVAAAVASSVVGLRLVSQSLDSATDPRVYTPTRGDLRDDHEFTTWALRTWQGRGSPGSTAVGAPHLYWAGRLVPGRTAMIIEPVQNGRTRFGVIQDRPSADPIVASTEVGGTGRTPAFRLDNGGRTVVAFESAATRTFYLSPKVLRDAAGRTRREWLPMGDRDGIAATELGPPDDGGYDPRLLDREPGARIDLDHEIIPMPVGTVTPELDAFVSSGPQWGMLGAEWSARAGTPPPADLDERRVARIFVSALNGSGMIDPASSFEEKDTVSWFGLFGLSGGRTGIVSGYRPGHAGTAEAFTVVVNARGGVERVIRGRPTPRNTRTVVSPLGDDGWAALAKGGTLSYRTGPDQPWLGTRPEALLVPPSATQIRTEWPDAAPQDINVP